MPTFRTKADVQSLFTDTSGELFGYARKKTKAPSVAEDLVQAIFANIVRTLPVDMANPRSFLFHAVRNAIIDWARKHARKAVDVDAVKEQDHPAKDETETRDLRDAVDALPEPQCEIVYLIYWGRLAEKEVAVELNMPEREVTIT